ncbi:MAG TPA: DUF58 domain-containing protein [Chromatiaceae bacterium]|nr:DUF58 domain-containing protein [Chromatiaceae bacterium]
MPKWPAQWIRVVRPDKGGRARITGRKIYILPTGYGLVFGILLLLLLIASINYANNPAFLLTFLLAGIFVQAIFHTWRNLKGLELRWLESHPAFAGETVRVRFLLSDPERDHHSLQLAFADNEPTLASCAAGSQTPVEVSFRSRRRGLIRPGRLRVESRYPLGLLRAWSLLETGAEVLVWPRPLREPLATSAPIPESSPEGDRGVGSDDFIGHRNYHAGDAPGQIHWKAFAAGKGLLVKQFGGDRVERLWLDFESLPAKDTEIRLSLLSGAIDELSTTPLRYGMRLPGLEIEPASGEAHRRHCLDALALFGMEETAS